MTARITAIREALTSVLTDPALRDLGLKTVEPYPPAKLAGGSAWIGFFDDDVHASQRELHIYTVPLTVVVQLNAQHRQGLQNTEPLIDAVLAVIRVNQKMAGAPEVYRVEPVRIQQGVWMVGQVEFIGFQVTLVIKETFGATYR